MTFIEQLHQSIETRLQELRAEISKIEEARNALNNGTSKPPGTKTNGSSRRPATARAKSKLRRRRQKAQVLGADQLERILAESSDGLSTSAIAEQGGADPAQVLTLLRELEKAGEVRRTGARRGTRWHLITDEDRVAQRAAELASRSKG